MSSLIRSWVVVCLLAVFSFGQDAAAGACCVFQTFLKITLRLCMVATFGWRQPQAVRPIGSRLIPDASCFPSFRRTKVAGIHGAIRRKFQCLCHAGCRWAAQATYVLPGRGASE